MTLKRIVVMGVSGCGKSTVGALVAEALGLPFIDGDDLHPQANKDKMASGTPLNDEDRWPWLDLVGDALDDGAVVACSALKRVYRERILAAAPGTVFVHLAGTRALLLERMQSRQGHFFKPNMLDSQLETLQPLEADEPGFTLDIALSAQELVAEINRRLQITWREL